MHICPLTGLQAAALKRRASLGCQATAGILEAAPRLWLLRWLYSCWRTRGLSTSSSASFLLSAALAKLRVQHCDAVVWSASAAWLRKGACRHLSAVSSARRCSITPAMGQLEGALPVAHLREMLLMLLIVLMVSLRRWTFADTNGQLV